MFITILALTAFVIAGEAAYFSVQGTATIDILKEALFKFQLERNGLTGTPYEISIAVAASTNTEQVYGSMDWEEISR